MILQLNPAIPLDTPRGPGLAHLVIDEGIESHLLWVVFLDSNGECWTFANPEIRAQKNSTAGRMSNSLTGNGVPRGQEDHQGS